MFKIKNRHKKNIFSLSFFIVVLIISNYFYSTPVKSATIQELKSKIEDQKAQIEKLNEEIEIQRKNVTKLSNQAQTLQGTVNGLQASENKIAADIKKTNKEIEKKQLEIEKISLEINETESKIDLQYSAVAQAFRNSREIEETPLIEIILGANSLSDFFNEMERYDSIRKELQNSISELVELTNVLSDKQTDKLSEKTNLVVLTKDLGGQKEAVQTTKAEKTKILTETKNQEANFKKLLEQKIAEKNKIEAAITEYESQIKTLVDKESITKAGAGILAWPVSPIIITQEFGGTQFAKNNPGIYGRPMHNGTDFGVPIGTKILAAADGVVIGTGNTDAFPGCYSWGKWIAVRHSGLKLVTLYAHLSAIQVTTGEKVTRGQTIGLSGNTGYSTGPHLHFTLYSDQGVEIRKFSEFKTATKCAGATTPTAPLEAYLDPMKYLPKL